MKTLIRYVVHVLFSFNFIISWFKDQIMIILLKGCWLWLWKEPHLWTLPDCACVCVCRCCSPLAGRPPLLTSVWSVLGCSATRSECYFIPPFWFQFSQVLLNSCVQQRQDSGERQGPDQRGSYLCYRISAAWTLLIHWALSACWHTAGPSTLQRRQHPGTQSENILLIFIAVCHFDMAMTTVSVLLASYGNLSHNLKYYSPYLLYFLIGLAQCWQVFFMEVLIEEAQ